MECRERFAHPDGYILSETPINPKYIFGDSSLLFRISMRTPEGKFFPATFVVDTLNVVSGRKVFALSPSEHRNCWLWLQMCSMIRTLHQNDMSKDFYLSLGSYGTYGFDHTPESRDPANIIGLMLIGDLGLTVLSADKWEFERKEPYW
jgi:hypothetical protein